MNNESASPVALDELRPALATGEALEVEHVVWGRPRLLGGAGGAWRPRPHHELAGGDRVAARRTRAAVAE